MRAKYDESQQPDTQAMGKFAAFWRSVGRSVSHLATGIVHEGEHIIDEGFSTVKALGTDVVSVAHEASGAVKGVASSLALPIALAIGGIGAVFLLKR